MPTVTRRGLYLPRYRIGTGVIREQWGGGTNGVKSKVVQAKDDDPTTLAVKAGRIALNGRVDIDALFFASTTPIYKYGSITPFLAESLGLNDDTYVQTFRESARAGTAALRAAGETVAAGTDSVLVIAAETPSPSPETDWEKTAGAGAAAVLIEANGDGLNQVGSASCARPVLDEWQAPGGSPLQSADDRFGRDVGYIGTTQRAIESVLDHVGWEPDDVDTFAVTHPNGKFAGRLASAIGVGDGALATPSFGRKWGNLRAASALGSLSQAELTADNNVVIAGYGVGTADAVAYEVTAPLTPATNSDETVELNYVEYLEHIGQLE